VIDDVSEYGDNKLVIPVPVTVPFKVEVPEFVNAVCEVVPFNILVILVRVAYVLLAVVLNKYDESEDERAYEESVDEVT